MILVPFLHTMIFFPLSYSESDEESEKLSQKNHKILIFELFKNLFFLPKNQKKW